MASFSRDDARHIAVIARTRRPRWAESAILQALEALATEGYTPGQALDTCLRAAADPKAETPVMIPRYAPQAPTATPLGMTARCQDHPWQPAHNCGACRSEVLTGDRLERDMGRKAGAQ